MRRLVLIGCCLAPLFAGPAGAVPSFSSLGDLSGGFFSSYGHAVSADGSAVVGYSNSASGNRAFRWTAAGGMVNLDSSVGGGYSQALGVSADGSTVVGFSLVSQGTRSFRWTEAEGMVFVPEFPGASPSYHSTGRAVSADGSVVVGGCCTSIGGTSYRWTEATGMVDLGLLPGESFGTTRAISSDGTVAAGRSGSHAYRWTDAGGMLNLGDLPGGNDFADAHGISLDGQVIVGSSSSSSGGQAFRWDEANGMVGLGDIPGGSFNSAAYAVSGDGSVIVGRGNYAGTGNQDAFIWDAENGMQDLRLVLIGLGLDLTGWDLWEAQGISADGRTITGFGTNPSGSTEAWIATIPEPSTALLLGFGLTAMAAGRRA